MNQIPSQPARPYTLVMSSLRPALPFAIIKCVVCLKISACVNPAHPFSSQWLISASGEAKGEHSQGLKGQPSLQRRRHSFSSCTQLRNALKHTRMLRFPRNCRVQRWKVTKVRTPCVYHQICDQGCYWSPESWFLNSDVKISKQTTNLLSLKKSSWEQKVTASTHPQLKNVKKTCI